MIREHTDVPEVVILVVHIRRRHGDWIRRHPTKTEVVRARYVHPSYTRHICQEMLIIVIHKNKLVLEWQGIKFEIWRRTKHCVVNLLGAITRAGDHRRHRTVETLAQCDSADLKTSLEPVISSTE